VVRIFPLAIRKCARSLCCITTHITGGDRSETTPSGRCRRRALREEASRREERGEPRSNTRAGCFHFHRFEEGCRQRNPAIERTKKRLRMRQPDGGGTKDRCRETNTPSTAAAWWCCCYCQRPWIVRRVWAPSAQRVLLPRRHASLFRNEFKRLVPQPC